MITDVLTLLEMLRKLVERKGELDKKHFDDFVQPIWDAFTLTHENYKKDFRRYADLLAQPDYPLEKLVAEIRRDSIYTQDLRINLSELLKQSVDEPFARGITYYFSLQRNQEFEIDTHGTDHVELLYYRTGIDNLPRYKAVIYLSSKGVKNIDRDKALDFFDNIVKTFQENYEFVSAAYHQLKRDLID